MHPAALYHAVGCGGGGAEGNKCSPVACGAVVLQVIKSYTSDQESFVFCQHL